MKTRIVFEERRLLAVAVHGSLDALRRVGAYIRKAARNEVSQSSKASTPGSPPNTRRGLLKRSLLFGLDKSRRRVLVGPAGSLIGTSMTAHEFGGTYRKRHYPKRPLMGPVINKTAAKLPKLWENAVKQ